MSFKKCVFYSCVLIFLFLGGVFFYYINNIPNYKNLSDYSFSLITRVYSSDSSLIYEYGKERRYFTPSNMIPEKVKVAFIAAEDSSFYTNDGIDLGGVFRALISNIKNSRFGSVQNTQLAGGSTITQQLVKNLLLNNEQSISRKIKEAILAYKISKNFSKDNIMELYLNYIYFGHGAYGISAASLTYFNKNLEELDYAEIALLAGLPKAPSVLDPFKNPDKALKRRNWVLERMHDIKLISKEELHDIKSKPIILSSDYIKKVRNINFFHEEVVKGVIDKFGNDAVDSDGMSVFSTMNIDYQNKAERALVEGLVSYDVGTGWRGAIDYVNIEEGDINLSKLQEKKNYPVIKDYWDFAVIKDDPNESTGRVNIVTSNNVEGFILLKNLSWTIDEEYGGYYLSKGDIVAVEKSENDLEGYFLRQVPEVNGSIIIIDVDTGAILAMVGGYDYRKSQYNAAIHAMRQPGSVLKPFTYIAALENGFTISTVIRDEPVEVFLKNNSDPWIPRNIDNKYLNDLSMRLAFEQSRNPCAISIGKFVGLEKISEVTKRFGIYDKDDKRFYYADILGAKETNLLKITNAFAMIANGGKRVEPHFIHKISDKDGNVLKSYNHPNCKDCSDTVSDFVDDRETVLDPVVQYQIVSLLTGVVKNGTGRRLGKIKGEFAAKTGTSSNNIDHWMVGFNNKIAIGVHVGFDIPKSLGDDQIAAKVALPIMKKLIQKIQTDEDEYNFFPIPPGIEFVKVGNRWGEKHNPESSRDWHWEAFPSDKMPVDKRIQYVDLEDYIYNY